MALTLPAMKQEIGYMRFSYSENATRKRLGKQATIKSNKTGKSYSVNSEKGRESGQLVIYLSESGKPVTKGYSVYQPRKPSRHDLFSAIANLTNQNGGLEQSKRI